MLQTTTTDNTLATIIFSYILANCVNIGFRSQQEGNKKKKKLKWLSCIIRFSINFQQGFYSFWKAPTIYEIVLQNQVFRSSVSPERSKRFPRRKMYTNNESIMKIVLTWSIIHFLCAPFSGKDVEELNGTELKCVFKWN